ncbi:phosphatase PAP2 family protein [bacterium]
MLVLIIIPISAFSQSGSYQYKKKMDPVLISSGTGLMLTSLYLRSQTQPLDPSNLDKSGLLGVDRWVCGPEQPVFSHMSDITLISSVLLPYFAAYQQKEKWPERRIKLLITFEAQLLTLSICTMIKEWVRRPRPYVYHTPGELIPKLSSEASRSFFSGHSSIAFCSAIAAGQMIKQSQNNAQQQTIWCVGLSLATCTSIFRILARKHFPTDVLAGILFGSLVGYTLPEIHQ